MKNIQKQASCALTLTQEMFDRFAALSGDDNPIHTSPEFASTTRFKKTVAHGMFLYSVFNKLLNIMAPEEDVLETELMFPAPSRLGDKIRFKGEYTGLISGKNAYEFEATRESDGEVVCALSVSTKARTA